MSSKFTDSQPTIELKVNSPTANVGITDAEYNIRLNPDVEADIFATKTELSAVENKIPAEYVKSAAVADNKLTLTKQDNTVVEFEGGGSYTLPVASTTTLGGVKPDGTTTTVDEDGTIHAHDTTPIATTTTVGSVKPDGTTITIDSNGVITANIPTKTSDLTNDSDFITTEYHDSTKQDKLVAGNNITISANNVISATGGGEPDAYIKEASVSGNTPTLTKKDNSTVAFTPEGGSGGGSTIVYKFSTNVEITPEMKAQLIDCANNREKITLIDGELVICIDIDYTNGSDIDKIYFTTITSQSMSSMGSDITYGEVSRYNYYEFSMMAFRAKIQKRNLKKDNRYANIQEPKHLESNISGENIKTGEYDWIIDWAAGKPYEVWVDNSLVYYKKQSGRYLYLYILGVEQGNWKISETSITFTDNTFKKLDSTRDIYTSNNGTLLTSNNWQNYITISGGGDWQNTTDTSNSNLYQAKEVVIFWQDNQSSYHQTYLNVGCDPNGNTGSTWGNTNWLNTEICLDADDTRGHPSITYNGSYIATSNCSINSICYKT